MSSSEETHEDRDKARAKRDKKRRMRACDMCRRRKVRCDGSDMPGNTCSNCITFKYKCTYMEAATKRQLDSGYIESLEAQLTEMRKTLSKYRQLCPGIAFNDDSTNTPLTDTQSPFAPVASGSEVSSPLSNSPQLHAGTLVNRALRPSMSPMSDETEDLDPSDDEARTHEAFVESFADLSLKQRHDHFFGKSSSLMLIQTAMDMREEYEVLAREGVNMSDGKKPQLWRKRRPIFWTEHGWVEQLQERRTRHLEYPDPDLIDELIALYFIEFNIYLPLLHRPTFERSVREGLHLRNADFGCVLLLVCALGAQHSNDPRVLLHDYKVPEGVPHEEDEEDGTNKWRWHSAGWKWFLQVHDYKSLLNPSAQSLADLQVLCLATLFTSSPHSAWALSGIGLRYAQDLGAHRRKVYNNRSGIDNELLKRAFWVLLFLDRLTSSSLGRPCAIQDEDIDLDLPIACDDEYWTNPNPELAFKQPEGKPSTVTFFNCALRLTQIHAFALRTIYSINKSKAALGISGLQWEQRIVAELDSALNNWIDSVPDHLRWNPHMENLVFLNQSALLYGSYYCLQIVVHRPFIPSPRKPSGITFPSLEICTNAARSCIHVLDVHAKRVGRTSPLSQVNLFNAGIVLLVNIWGAKRSGTIADPIKEMKEVHKAMNMLKSLETRWFTAGRVWDILYILANVGDLPLPGPNVRMSQKRTRSSDETAEPSTSDGISPAHEARPIAGTRRVQQYQQHASSSSSSGSFSVTENFDYPLPLHSDELGRLPLYPFFDPNLSTAVNSNSVSTSSPQPVQSGTQWFPSSFGAIPGSLCQPVSSQDAREGGELDAVSLESIFNMFAPTSYQSAETPSDPGAEFPYLQNLAPMSDNMGGTMPQTRAPDMQEPVAQNSFENGALAMWSDAPSGFEWDDWSSYVNTFGSGL